MGGCFVSWMDGMVVELRGWRLRTDFALLYPGFTFVIGQDIIIVAQYKFPARYSRQKYFL